MALLPLTNGQRIARFGQFRFIGSPKNDNPERIVVCDNWAIQNLTTVKCPQLRRLFGVERVNIHHMAAKAFLELWDAWEKAGLLHLVLDYEGAYSARYKRGSAPRVVVTAPKYASAALSNHSWGTAFDINAKEYPLGHDIDINDEYRLLEDAANAIGWFCGGRFNSRKDWMHWEYTGLAPAKSVLEAAQQLRNPPITLFINEIKQRQALIGLKADGIVGPKTLAHALDMIRMAA